MKFLPYEDVPLALVRDNNIEYIFAESATLSVSQPLSASRQLDDNLIQIHSSGDGFNDIYNMGTFVDGENITVTFGPTNSPPQPLATSIYKIPKDTKITFPNNKHLYFSNDIWPDGHNYVTELYANSGGWDLTTGEAQSGYFEPIFNYYANGGVRGTLDVDFYLDTGNLSSFFNITGILDPMTYPPTEQDDGFVGLLGDFSFDQAYLKSFSFSVSPNSISQASASFDVYGDLNKFDGASDFHESYLSNSYKNKSIAHGQNTQLIGALKLDMEHPIGFTYSISVDRVPRYDLPTGNQNAIEGLTPSRVSRKSTKISMSIQGENLDPDMTFDNYFHGRGANLEVDLFDLSYNNFETDSNGYMHSFQCSGIVESNSISVNSAGYLDANISVSQHLR